MISKLIQTGIIVGYMTGWLYRFDKIGRTKGYDSHRQSMEALFILFFMWFLLPLELIINPSGPHPLSTKEFIEYVSTPTSQDSTGPIKRWRIND